jgi:predicted transcriptional regulator
MQPTANEACVSGALTHLDAPAGADDHAPRREELVGTLTEREEQVLRQFARIFHLTSKNPTITETAKASGLSPQRAWCIFNALQEGGFVWKNGRRAGALNLTEKGWQLACTTPKPVLSDETRLNSLRAALRRLHQVCLDMDLEDQMQRPSEEEYQAAMAGAAAVLAL